MWHDYDFIYLFIHSFIYLLRFIALSLKQKPKDEMQKSQRPHIIA